MAKFIIGNVEYEVSQLSFKTLKKIYPIIATLRSVNPEALKSDPSIGFDAIDGTLKIVSAALEKTSTPRTFEQLEEELMPSEILGLQTALSQLIQENGLGRQPGEPKAAPEEGAATSPSTETSTE